LIIITGCEGFIGKNLIDSLEKDNMRVLGIDQKISSKNASDSIEKLEIDLSNKDEYSKLSDYLQNSKDDPIVLVHLAAINDKAVCEQDKELAYNINVLAFKQFYTFVHKHQPLQKIVFSSSALVYGTKNTGPVTENDRIDPEGEYTRNKAAAEEDLITFCKEKSIDPVILRLSNVYGPGMNRDTVIMTIIEQLQENRIALREYQSIRDFVFIKDVVRAFMHVITNRTKETVYNIGTTRGTSMYDLIKIIAKKMNKEESVPVLSKGSLSKGSRLLVRFDNIKNEFNWSPSYTLEEGISEMV
ncbi:MAG: NAD(P)-dependent oxidoreductase, partial [Spirochaetes bacterium]|nr:NAD(P)-dependent oxidoreductase [Spirochaetota bacterium]